MDLSDQQTHCYEKKRTPGMTVCMRMVTSGGCLFQGIDFYMHMSFKRKVGLVVFTQVLSYLNSEWVCIHLHILQPLWKSDLETSNTSLWAHFRSPEEDERWVRTSHNGVRLLLVQRDHVNNVSEAYLEYLQVCLQIYTKGEHEIDDSCVTE